MKAIRVHQPGPPDVLRIEDAGLGRARRAARDVADGLGFDRRGDGHDPRPDPARARRDVLRGHGRDVAGHAPRRARPGDDAGGVDGVLELVGTQTLLDSLQAVRPGGIVCYTGILGNAWVLERFEPLEAIPSTVRLTTYHSGTTSAERSTEALQAIADGVAEGRYRPNLHRTFRFEEIVEAHRFMEGNHATGKLVVIVDR